MVISMVKEWQGNLGSPDGRFAIVVSRVNERVTKSLLESAFETLKRHGVQDERVEVVWVPGSFEIPFIAHRLASGNQFAAVICLGCVLKGETPHNTYINQQVAAGLNQAGFQTGIPVIYGVLTCDTMEQAIQRSGGKSGNKGMEAALAAIEVVNLISVMDNNS